MNRGAALGFILIVVSCADAPRLTPTEPYGDATARIIVDAAHNGRQHFYFLPPLVPKPATTGTFDGTVEPIVEIIETTQGVSIARYTMSSGVGSEIVRRDAAGEHYIVNWHTDQFNLDPALGYRIVVRVGATELGYADLAVLEDGRGLKNLDTEEYVALVDGRTLPVKFRVEHGIPGALAVAPVSGSIGSLESFELIATVLDLHGQPLPGEPVVWSGKSDPATGVMRDPLPVEPVNTVTDAAGTARTRFTAGLSSGLATITAVAGAHTAASLIEVRVPMIGISASQLHFDASFAQPSPAAQTISIINAGRGALTDLTAEVVYGENQPAGWLSATLDNSTAPSTLTLRAETEGSPLAAGSYAATVLLKSPVAGNSPQSIAVTVDLTDMLYHTSWGAPGSAVLRDHRAIAGQPRPLDIDDVPGPDIILDTDYTPATIALTVTADAEREGELGIIVSRDASAPDDRVLHVQLGEIPQRLTLAVDAERRSVGGSVTAPLEMVVVQLHHRGESDPSAVNVDARFEGIVGSFEVTMREDINVSMSDAAGLVEARARTANRGISSLPSGASAVVMTSDAAGFSVAMRLLGVRSFQMTPDPLVLRNDGSSSGTFFVDVQQPGKTVNIRLDHAPPDFTLTTAEAPGGSSSLRLVGSGELDRMEMSAQGISSLATGGQFIARLTSVPAEVSMDLSLNPPDVGVPVRFDIRANRAMELLELSMRAPGATVGSSILLTTFTQLRGCIAMDGTCRPADHLPDALPNYGAIGTNPAQSADAGGLNRPYAASASIDLDAGSSSGTMTLSASINRGDGVPIVIQNLRFRKFTFDAGIYRESPTFVPGPNPRYYLYLDSGNLVLSLAGMQIPGVIESFTIATTPLTTANRRLVWLPGPTCTLAESGDCVPNSEVPDLRTNGTASCGNTARIVMRVEGTSYELKNFTDGRSALCN